MHQANELKMTALSAMMAALTAVGAYIAIPVGPVPVVLQNLFVYMMGLLLGPKWGLAGIGAYVLAGAVGMPIFAGGKGGIGHIVGPTGGYLIGFVPAVGLAGWISVLGAHRLVADAGAVILATIVIYALGLGWLGVVSNMSFYRTMMVGMLPFLPGDILKMAAAVMLARSLRPMLPRISDAT